jgi:hypothetical protein
MFGVCDAEGDDVTVEIEIVEHGNPFTQTTTYSASGSVLQQQSTHCQVTSSDPPCGCFELQLTGLRAIAATTSPCGSPMNSAL